MSNTRKNLRGGGFFKRLFGIKSNNTRKNKNSVNSNFNKVKKFNRYRPIKAIIHEISNSDSIKGMKSSKAPLVTFMVKVNVIKGVISDIINKMKNSGDTSDNIYNTFKSAENIVNDVYKYSYNLFTVEKMNKHKESVKHWNHFKNMTNSEFTKVAPEYFTRINAYKNDLSSGKYKDLINGKFSMNDQKDECKYALKYLKLIIELSNKKNLSEKDEQKLNEYITILKRYYGFSNLIVDIMFNDVLQKYANLYKRIRSLLLVPYFPDEYDNLFQEAFNDKFPSLYNFQVKEIQSANFLFPSKQTRKKWGFVKLKNIGANNVTDTKSRFPVPSNDVAAYIENDADNDDVISNFKELPSRGDWLNIV
jgi:hypothetical protein